MREKLEEVADEGVQARHVRAELVGMPLRLGREAVLEGLGDRADARERREQVVRDAGDEVAPRRLRPLRRGARRR